MNPGSVWDPPDTHARRARERDTVDVDEPASTSDRWSLSSVGDALGWWFGPLLDRRTWTALGYLGVGALWSVAMFTAMVVALAMTFGLSFVIVGLALVVPTFAMVDAMVTVERHRAEWVGRSIERRPVRSSPGGVWHSMTTTLADPERWRQVGFVALFLVAGPALFALALAAWIVILVVAIGELSSLGGVDVLAVLAALVVLGVAPRINVAVSNLAAAFVAWFVGPDPTVELAGRVEELASQRAEILDAVAAERRRIERDLHDGVQQQLVALGIDIGRAQARLDDDPDTAREILDGAKDTVRAAIGEMRVIGRGLHPAVLEDRGLDAALSSVVAASPIPIAVDIDLASELPEDTAATAYYVVNEALANVLKHARARSASVRIAEVAGVPRSLRITVHDDGQGGAEPAGGTGLAGIRARVEGADGEFRIDSPGGGPTTLVAVVPVSSTPMGADGIDA